MSAEDRAREVLADYLARNARLTVMAYDTVAHELLEALSSEGLAVVAQEDVLTPIEAEAVLGPTPSRIDLTWCFDSSGIPSGIGGGRSTCLTATPTARCTLVASGSASG